VLINNEYSGLCILSDAILDGGNIMHKQQATITIFLCLIISAAVGGYVYWQIRDNDEVSDKISSPIETNRSDYPANTSPNTTPQAPSLKVQGATTMQASEPSAKTSLPEPNGFEVYEQYANDQTASFIDVVVGQGVEAVNGKKIAMLYKGWLTNGELFDESRTNAEGLLEPFVFQLGAGQVIAGWEQAIAGMKEGGKRRLIIPYTAGYGETGQGPIPAKSMLIFDVELIEVEK
jgi:FKBP-type peptidyl-prolyl cis-trans isomerase